MPARKDSSGRSRTRKKVRSQRTRGQSASVEARAPIATRISVAADLGTVLDRIGKAHRADEFRVACIRPDDLLVCDFIFENLRLDVPGEGAPRLIRKVPNTSSALIVELPPQSFGEEAFLEKTGDEANTRKGDKFPESGEEAGAKPKNIPTTNSDDLLAMPCAKIRMAGRSRLAFSMPAAEEGLPFTIDAILDACRRWPMQLDVNAVPDPSPFHLVDHLDLDPWLSHLAASGSWARAAETLVSALGENPAISSSLAGGARRVAARAIEAVRAGKTQGVEAGLRRAMEEELDVLADHVTPLGRGTRREAAAAALSLMATREIAKYRTDNALIDHLKNFPFFQIVFGPHRPAQNVTALELPYRLLISPVADSRWHHSTQPVTRHGRTELWHTRLASTGADVGPDGSTRIRALWSPDYGLPGIVGIVNDNKPFRMSLDPLDREMLVKLMSGFDQVTNRKRPYHPRTAQANRLALSSLGALLDAEGSWAPPSPSKVSLEQWRHIATLGRDHYVRVVYRGFLKEFGHAASLVKVTERKFETHPSTGGRVAVLRQRFFIVVREPLKHYDGTGHAYGGRPFPFTDVEILTKVTPDLRAPDKPECLLSDTHHIIYNAVPARACFWPMTSPTNNFLFQIAATDRAGNRVTFAMPLLFVGSEANEDPTVLREIIEQNNATAAFPRRTAALRNASVCYAPIKDGAEGDTRLPTQSIVFKAVRRVPNSVPPDQVQFYPELEKASVGITAIQRLLQKPDATVDVSYPQIYNETAGGFGGANAGELFLKLTTPFDLSFGEGVKSDALGGLATPSMAILGLSRIMGPVSAQKPSSPGPGAIESALGDIVSNTFNPASFFDGAKILGGVDLKDLLDLVVGLAGAKVPKLLSKQLVDRVEARFDWETPISHGDATLGLFVPNAGGTTRLAMHGIVSAPIINPSATTFQANASIGHFKVNLFGFVTVWFDELRFSAKSGSKPDVAVDLHPGNDAIAFGGPLEFVNTLREIIPSNGFSDPPGLSVTPSGISASYSINVPSLAVGIFALEHLSLGAGFLLPFDAKPAEVRFNFSERQRPFSLTVSLLGGGGFFAICVGTEGVREIEAALEFGAAVSINLGVASGSVEIKAGIYFHWKTKSVELAGYVRLHGELSVLGLISASLTFNLQIAYLKEGGRSVVWGEATLEVEIDILFLSFSVSVKCRREFGGADSDPKFIALIPDQSTWDAYCRAFATEAA